MGIPSSQRGYNSSFRGASAVSSYYEVMASDWGTIQSALPAIAASESADFCVIVPTQGNWRQQSAVGYVLPDGTPQSAGISISDMSISNPLYPGVGIAVVTGTVPTSFCVLSGYLYRCTTSGTTAATFIGGGAFKQTKGATTNDGTVVWTSQGKATIIVIHFTNSIALASPPVNGIPAAMEIDFFAL